MKSAKNFFVFLVYVALAALLYEAVFEKLVITVNGVRYEIQIR
jgi:hypothetical protein